MVALGACGAAALHLVCSAAWFFITGTTVVEADASSDRVPEVGGRVGRRAGEGSRNGAGSAPQGQTHPGIILTVLVFALLAFLSAICIAKRYCFPQGNQTYVYSTLRRYEELNLPDENTQSRQQLDSSESDQDLRE